MNCVPQRVEMDHASSNPSILKLSSRVVSNNIIVCDVKLCLHFLLLLLFDWILLALSLTLIYSMYMYTRTQLATPLPEESAGSRSVCDYINIRAGCTCMTYT